MMDSFSSLWLPLLGGLVFIGLLFALGAAEGLRSFKLIKFVMIAAGFFLALGSVSHPSWAIGLICAYVFLSTVFVVHVVRRVRATRFDRAWKQAMTPEGK